MDETSRWKADGDLYNGGIQQLLHNLSTEKQSNMVVPDMTPWKYHTLNILAKYGEPQSNQDSIHLHLKNLWAKNKLSDSKRKNTDTYRIWHILGQINDMGKKLE